MTEIPTVLSRASILEKLNAALVRVSAREPKQVSLGESTTLREDLGLDSFAAIELVFELEDQVGVSIPQEAAMSFKTVGDVVTYVLGQMSAAQASAAELQEGAREP
jgi:acyl carrier protein